MLRQHIVRWSRSHSPAAAAAARPVTAWVSGRALDLDALSAKLRAAGVGMQRYSAAVGTTTAAGRRAVLAPGAGASFATAGDAQPLPLQTMPAVRAAAQPNDVLLFTVPFDWRYQAAQGGAADGPEVKPAAAGCDVVAAGGEPSSAATRRTYVLFSEGAIVGWNAEWSELLSVWRLAVENGPGSTPGNTVTEQLTFVTRAEADAERSAAAGDGESQAVGASSSGAAGCDDVPAAEESYIDDGTDRIVLADDDEAELKLPFSYALVQSVKIDVIEATLTPIVRSVKLWQRQLAQSGKLRCSLRQLRQSKTSLFALLEQLNFSHGPHTTPKLFWAAEHQRHRGVYKSAKEHLELEDRLEFLQDRIETVDESLAYLHEELHVSTEEFLTWIIIWLIVIEIVLAMELHTRGLRLARYIAGVDSVETVSTTAPDA